MMNIKTMTALIALGALAGCVIENNNQTRPTQVQPTGIEGNWQNSEGLYNASFSGQTLRWTDTQSGGLLVSGTYSRVNQTDYTLVMNSQTTGRTLRANCRLATLNNLNCTREDGQRFSMIRLAG